MFLYQRRPSQAWVLFPGGQRVVRRQQTDAQCKQIGREVDWDIGPVARRRSYFANCGRRREPKARALYQGTWSYPGQSFDFCCSCYSCVQGLTPPMGLTTHTPSFNTRRRQHISVQHRGSTHWLLQLNLARCIHVVDNQAATSAELVGSCGNRDELMRSPFCGHFTGCPLNIGWPTSWPFLRSTCDSRRHRPTWTVSSLTLSLHLKCQSGRQLVLWWQSQGLTLCARAALSACVLQSYGTVFRRIFN